MTSGQALEKGYVKASFSLPELANIKSAVVGGRACSGRTSLAFAARLAHAYSNGLGYHQILDELDYLEGLRGSLGTKAEAPFKGPELRPLWHKHFSAPRHVLKNIGLHWGLGGQRNRDLNRMLRRIAEKASSDWIGQVCHQFVMGGYEQRVRECRLTGDWIIFAKHEGRNYYLDLATHAEADDQQALMQKIRLGSEAEFPFLFR